MTRHTCWDCALNDDGMCDKKDCPLREIESEEERDIREAEAENAEEARRER